MSDHSTAGRTRRLAILAGALVAVVGILLVVIGIRGQQTPPEPPLTSSRLAAQGGPGGSSAPTPTPGSTRTGGSNLKSGKQSVRGPGAVGITQGIPTIRVAKSLPRSVPRSISIPRIGVTSSLLNLGANPDNTIEVPAGADVDKAGWFNGSPSPGQDGPSVILGHIDSQRSGPSVFFKLGGLKNGDTAYVTRDDGKRLPFTVYRVARFAKSSFPTTTVYGNTPGPELRLITCGGRFDPRLGHHLDNIVIYLKEKIIASVGAREVPQL